MRKKGWSVAAIHEAISLRDKDCRDQCQIWRPALGGRRPLGHSPVEIEDCRPALQKAGMGGTTGTKDREIIMQSAIEREARAGFPFPRNVVEGQGMATTTLGGVETTTLGREDKTFERVRTQLKARLGGEVFSSWFGRMKLAETSKGVARLSVPTAFLRSWINGHYLELISELWKLEEPEVLRVEIVVRSATRQGRSVPDFEQATARKGPRPPQTALGSGTLGAVRPDRQRRAAARPSGKRIAGTPTCSARLWTHATRSSHSSRGHRTGLLSRRRRR